MVLLIGGVIIFNMLLHEINIEAYQKVNSWIDNTVTQIEREVPLSELMTIKNISIEELDYDAPLIPHYESDSMAVFPPKMIGEDRKLTMGASYKLNGKHYHISAYDFLTEPDEIVEGLSKSLIAIMTLFLLLVAIVNRLALQRMLSPLQRALLEIKHFSLKNQNPIILPNTNIEEFKELNFFLHKMTTKANYDYIGLKEFSENASHEIQTPLAIIRGKMELLVATGLNEVQTEYIMSIESALQKFSSLNQSLLLLTKLENQEYGASEKINFSEALSGTLAYFQELINMRSLKLKMDIVSDVHLLINPYLTEILLNNLISNAIRHNIPDGQVRIVLTAQSLLIENTGQALTVAAEDLFKRFKKGNQSNDSTGLGLSIVQQICTINNFSIRYDYASGWHSINITFSQSDY